jgi:hypothetical protein
MSFKRFGMTLCVAFAAVTLARATTPAEFFVAAQFTNAPAPSALVITGEVATAIQEIMGHPFARNQVPYWQAEGKTVWVLETRGRSNTITAGFVVRDGRMEKTEVLVYRERRGGEIKARSFTRQFDGVSLAEGRRLDRRIDGITGATISVNAMQNVARVALYLTALTLAR